MKPKPPTSSSFTAENAEVKEKNSALSALSAVKSLLDHHFYNGAAAGFTVKEAAERILDFLV